MQLAARMESRDQTGRIWKQVTERLPYKLLIFGLFSRLSGRAPAKARDNGVRDQTGMVGGAKFQRKPEILNLGEERERGREDLSRSRGG